MVTARGELGAKEEHTAGTAERGDEEEGDSQGGDKYAHQGEGETCSHTMGKAARLLMKYPYNKLKPF